MLEEPELILLFCCKVSDYFCTCNPSDSEHPTSGHPFCLSPNFLLTHWSGENNQRTELQSSHLLFWFYGWLLSPSEPEACWLSVQVSHRVCWGASWPSPGTRRLPAPPCQQRVRQSAAQAEQAQVCGRTALTGGREKTKRLTWLHFTL